MKNLMLIAAMSLFSFFATAQNTTLTIGTDIVGFYTEAEQTFGTRTLNLGLENAFAKRWTLSADIGIAKNSGFDLRVWKMRDKISAVRTGIKFYPKAAHKGFFIGTNLAYANLNRSFTGEDVPVNILNNGKYIGGGLDLGFNTSLGKRLTFGTFAGLNLMLNANDIQDDGLLQSNLGIKVGFKF